MNWEPYRRRDGSLNLSNAAADRIEAGDNYFQILGYCDKVFREIEKLQLISSRQAAAIAITFAIEEGKKRYS